MKNILFSLLGILFLLTNCNLPNNTPQFEELIDLTHSFDSTTIYWPNDTNHFQHPKNFYGETEKGYFYSSFRFSSPEHGGTHLDAPIHFAENHFTVDQIPLQNLIGEGIKINLREKVKGNPDFQISIQDILDWEKIHGEISPNLIILFETGWSDYYHDRNQYLGTHLKGDEALVDLHFPGIDPETCRWLLDNRQPKALGLDTPSLDYGQSNYFETHQHLLGANIPGFENLSNLNKIPETNLFIMALPMKIKKGSGAPLRIVTGIMK